MKRRVLAIVAIALMGMALLSACPSGTGGTPGPAPSLRCIFECGQTAPAKPIPSADAAARGGPECELDYYTPRMKDSLNVEGVFIVRCRKTPVLILITARLEFKNSAGNWVDESDIYINNRPPIPNVAQGHQVVAACYPGQWRLEGHWSGLKSDGKTPFPNPQDGDTPADWASEAVHLDCR